MSPKIEKVHHKHQVSLVMSNDGLFGSLNLKQLDDFINEARVEGAPEDAITFIQNVNGVGLGNSTTSIVVEWTVERDPYGEGLKG